MSTWFQVKAIVEHGGNFKDEAIYLGTWDSKKIPKPESADREVVRKFLTVIDSSRNDESLVLCFHASHHRADTLYMQAKYVDKRWYVAPHIALAKLNEQVMSLACTM